MEKYHKTDIAPVENENERDDTYQAVNPQIDFTRTKNNYNIIKRQRSYTQFINDKIEALDLPTKVRKDAVLMCSFVVGLDREFFSRLSPSEQQQFFVDCTRFLKIDKSNFNATPLLFKPQQIFCKSTTKAGASSTKGTCPSSQQKPQSSKPRTGNLKKDYKSAHATKAMCLRSIKRRSEKSRHFKAMLTFCAR